VISDYTQRGSQNAIYKHVMCYCISECTRQGDLTQHSFDRMFRGWQFLSELVPVKSLGLDMHMLRTLGALVTGSDLRQTPVIFANGNAGVHPHSIQYCLDNLVEAFNDNRVALEAFCQELLRIHPWIDGNGRTVSLLRNYLLDMLDYPQSMPEYNWN
jgi:Fic/DOC family